MLLIKAQRDRLLAPLQSVIGIVERRHTLPILSNVLIETAGDRLDFTATDLEVQVRTWTSVAESPIQESVTLSARKLHDILRALPSGAEIAMEASENRLTVKAGRSRFNLQTLPGRDFPQIALNAESGVEFSLRGKPGARRGHLAGAQVTVQVVAVVAGVGAQAGLAGGADIV